MRVFQGTRHWMFTLIPFIKFKEWFQGQRGHEEQLHQLKCPHIFHVYINNNKLANIWVISMLKPTFGDIKIEEVTVEDSLDHTSHYGNHVKEALKVETPDPVEEVKGPIQPQAEQVVGGDRLSLPGLADHEELRQNCHRLQVDGERPQDLQKTFTYSGTQFYIYSQNVWFGIDHVPHNLTAIQQFELTSRGEKSWLMRTERPPTGTTRNSTLKLSWFPS